jgi:hypothetical protein
VKDLVLREFLDFAEAGFLFEPSASTGGEDFGPGRLLAVGEELSRARGVPLSAVLRNFGTVLFRRLAVLFPIFFADTDSAFDFLSGLDLRVREDLAHLRFEAGFPSIECRHPQPGRLEILFRSDWPLADLAAGLIDGCGEYYREPLRLDRRYLLAAKGQAALFVVTRASVPAQAASAPERGRRDLGTATGV